MSDPLRGLRCFLSELKRRNVYRVAVAYVVVAAGALQLVDVVVPSTRLPGWSDELFLGLAVLGFPLALVFAWAFDVTPQGVRRTHSAPAQEGRSGADASEIASGPAMPGTGEMDEDPGAGVSAARREEGAEQVDPRTVAVLPFENLSGTEEAEPFAAGLHDDLLTELSRISELTMISRTSVRRYRDSEKTVPEIARELGVATVVEGGVQQTAGRVRLNVQLIDAGTDVHRWAERYDRELSAESIFGIQSELAEKIAGTLLAELAPGDADRLEGTPTDDLEAYRLYAHGRGLLEQRLGDTMARAVDYFESAIERDPAYALARAGLADALVLLVDYGHGDPAVNLPRGEEAARHALELDPSLAEAHASLGLVHSVRREGTQAIGRMERAVELRPGYAQAHQWMSWVNLLIGRPAPARSQGRRAVELNPLAPQARGNLALAHLGCGDARAARAEARRALEIQPGFDYARWTEGLALHHMGRVEEGDRVLGKIAESWGAGWPTAVRALALSRDGDQVGSRALLARLREEGRLFLAGLVHAALGESGAAFEAFEDAGALPWDETLYLRYRPAEPLVTVEDDPRLTRLVREVDRSWGVGDGRRSPGAT